MRLSSVLLLTCSFALSACGCPDSDGDGVCDEFDLCEGGEDGADADGDGVCDALDVCASWDDALDADEDGQPDLCDLEEIGALDVGEVFTMDCCGDARVYLRYAAESDQRDDAVAAGAELLFNAADVGSTTRLTLVDDPRILAFGERLVDGVDEDLTLIATGEDRSGGSSLTRSEQAWGLGEPDLNGFILLGIEVELLRFETSADPNLQDVEARWTFLGVED